MNLNECACIVNSDLQKEFETIMKYFVGIDLHILPRDN